MKYQREKDVIKKCFCRGTRTVKHRRASENFGFDTEYSSTVARRGDNPGLSGADRRREKRHLAGIQRRSNRSFRKVFKSKKAAIISLISVFLLTGCVGAPPEPVETNPTAAGVDFPDHGQEIPSSQFSPDPNALDIDEPVAPEDLVAAQNVAIAGVDAFMVKADADTWLAGLAPYMTEVGLGAYTFYEDRMLITRLPSTRFDDGAVKRTMFAVNVIFTFTTDTGTVDVSVTKNPETGVWEIDLFNVMENLHE